MSLREWSDCWKRANPVLEKMRNDEIRNSDTVAGVALYSGIVKMANEQKRPSNHSGLVEMQKSFLRLNRT